MLESNSYDVRAAASEPQELLESRSILLDHDSRTHEDGMERRQSKECGVKYATIEGLVMRVSMD